MKYAWKFIKAEPLLIAALAMIYLMGIIGAGVFGFLLVSLSLGIGALFVTALLDFGGMPMEHKEL